MTTADALDELRARLLAGYPILLLDTLEEARWQEELASLADEMDVGLVTWTATAGPSPPADGRADGGKDDRSLAAFLDSLDRYPPRHLFLLKDAGPHLGDPAVARRLRDLAARSGDDARPLLLIGSRTELPAGLDQDAVRVDLPLPAAEELRAELLAVLAEREAAGGPVAVDRDQQDRMVTALQGLAAREARRAVRKALLGRESFGDGVLDALVDEKRKLVRGNDLLEFRGLDEGTGEIGGLHNLKEWLARRASAFTPAARAENVPAPKGVLLLGVQGCGKSLTARVAARVLGFPLVRLDMANLLGGDVGRSEGNLRRVLRLMEAIAPAVLWLDEIEKGFAVASEGGGAGDAVVRRMFGTFLTWMEDRTAPVFVTATANSVDLLPPELLRRGRFDELFFVDLPNPYERRDVFRVHLTKRGWEPGRFDVEALSDRTEGYSGAEIEQIVATAMLEAHGRGDVMGQADLLEAAEETVPLSVTMEEKIFALREWAKGRCRPATPDSRVLRMMEEERKIAARTGVSDDEPAEQAAWARLAGLGQIRSGIAEYLRGRDRVLMHELVEKFAAHTDVHGDLGLALKADPNVILWTGLGESFAGEVVQLVRQKRLHLHPTSVDGHPDPPDGPDAKPAAHRPRLPVLTEPPDGRLDRPHWQPVSLRDLPAVGGAGRFARIARVRLAKR